MFIDGSVNNALKIGVGAWMLLTSLDTPLATARAQIRTQPFAATSSTRLELQLLLWALKNMSLPFDENTEITIYTDSQNTVGLNARRAKLERSHYLSASNKLLNNHELYREYFQLMDTHKCSIVKVAGHKPAGAKDRVDHLFALVDKAARQALREVTP